MIWLNFFLYHCSMKKLLLILLCLPLLVFSQDEKRLALVIGNANYDKGELKNPVNDALLIVNTLKQLDFDVILDTNLADKRSFKETIREFGNRRPNYDVAFVYYAGHGIQVGSENYLLPTKEIFESEIDVEDYGVSVQDIMRYLTGMSDQVNVLILDACRDNPFEGNWNKTRSLKGGGLAKIPPPTGSLIAFSTDAGNTAADGDGKNSVYSESLCRNMLLENISLDQVFRNVRSDVLKITNKQQRPVESSQLTGASFYLQKSNYDKEFKFVESLFVWNPYFDEEDKTPKYYRALEELNKIIGLDNQNSRAIYWLSVVYQALNLNDEALEKINLFIEMDSTNAQGYKHRSSIYMNMGKDSLEILAMLDDSISIALDPEDIYSYYSLISNYRGGNKTKLIEGISFINRALIIHPNNGEFYRQKGNLHKELRSIYVIENANLDILENEYKLAIEAYDSFIECDPENGFSYMQKGDFIADIGLFDDAIYLYQKASDTKPDEPSPYFAMIHSYFNLNDSLNKVVKLCEKLIALDIDDPRPYYLLSKYYSISENDNIKAATYMSISIFKYIDSYDPEGYNYSFADYKGRYSEYYINLFDLYMERYNLYRNLNIEVLFCNDLDNALIAIKKRGNEDWSDWYKGAKEIFLENLEVTEKLISENCLDK